MKKSPIRTTGTPSFRKPAIVAVLLSTAALAGCATPQKPPQIRYDSDVPALPVVPTVLRDERPKPLHIPPGWTPARGGATATTPTGRVQNANAAARVEPRRDGYYNAIQIYPWSEGALYQVYAAPGQITDITLEPGESLTGAGPIAAGDTTRWCRARSSPFRTRRLFRLSWHETTATVSPETRRRGGPSPSMTMAARSMSNSRAA